MVLQILIHFRFRVSRRLGRPGARAGTPQHSEGSCPRLPTVGPVDRSSQFYMMLCCITSYCIISCCWFWGFWIPFSSSRSESEAPTSHPLHAVGCSGRTGSTRRRTQKVRPARRAVVALGVPVRLSRCQRSPKPSRLGVVQTLHTSTSTLNPRTANLKPKSQLDPALQPQFD